MKARNRFELKFTTDSAAFVDQEEIIRILQKVAAQIKRGLTDEAVVDVNGNTVGQWFIEKEDDE